MKARLPSGVRESVLRGVNPLGGFDFLAESADGAEAREAWHSGCHSRLAEAASFMAAGREAGVENSRLSEKEIELLALRALAGERVALLLGRRRYALTLDPVFRIEDGEDGFLFLCLGLESLRRRLEGLSAGSGTTLRNSISKLGGAQGSH